MTDCKLTSFHPVALGLLALMLSLQPAHAQQLGRLFATQAERDAMEAQRGASGVQGAVSMPPAGMPVPQADPNLAPPASVAAPAGSNTLTMAGSLRSSHGRSTVWLNNVPQNDQQNRYSSSAGSAIAVTLPSGKQLILKPGQRYDLDAGRVKDVNEP